MMHHPPEDLLLEYAAGTLSRDRALLVAAHLTYCPSCRQTVAMADEIAGALAMEASPSIPVLGFGADDLTAIATTSPIPDAQAPVTKAGDTASRPHHRYAASVAGRSTILPKALRDVVGPSLEGIPWNPIFPGLWEHRLSDDPEGAGDEARLLCIDAGRAIPSHTHGGLEMTLVLSGGFRDARGHYTVGDVCTADGSVDHRPVADSHEDCICFAVVEAPMRFTGRVGRLLNFIEPHLARAGGPFGFRRS